MTPVTNVAGPRDRPAHLLRLSEDLPVVIEIVDTAEHVDRLVPILDEMVAESLVSMEKVRVLKYAAGTRPLDRG